MESQQQLSPTVTLSNGMKLPLIGLGTYAGENFEVLLRAALDIGYRHLDTAKVYKNEKQIGNVLAEVFKEGKIKREDLFITTKIWNDPSLDVYEAVKESLRDLNVDYVDLLLNHWPIGVPNADNTQMVAKPLHVFWKEIERCQKEGLCKAVGVSNFGCQIMMDLLTFAEVRPVVNQLEGSPYLTQVDLVTWCQKMGIHVTAYSPLCRGGTDVKGLIFGDIVDIFNDPVLKEIAEKHKRSIAQVVLNFMVGRGISVIPKSSSPGRLKDNFNCLDFQLDEEDKKRIFALNKGFRTINPKKREDMLFYPAFD